MRIEVEVGMKEQGRKGRWDEYEYEYVESKTRVARIPTLGMVRIDSSPSLYFLSLFIFSSCLK
jgi:hypothetical protein